MLQVMSYDRYYEGYTAWRHHVIGLISYIHNKYSIKIISTFQNIAFQWGLAVSPYTTIHAVLPYYQTLAAVAP